MVISQSKQHTIDGKDVRLPARLMKDINYFNTLGRIRLDAKQRAFALNAAGGWLFSAS
jgi:hypothetical protein